MYYRNANVATYFEGNRKSKCRDFLMFPYDAKKSFNWQVIISRHLI